MKRTRALFYALMFLAIGVGIAVAFIADGVFAGNNVVAPPLSSSPIMPFSNPSPIGYRSFLQVDYRDNHNLNDPPVGYDGFAVNNMNFISIRNEYGSGIAGVVNTTGTFSIRPLQGATFRYATILFHEPRTGGDSWDWAEAEEIQITTTTAPGDILIFRLNIPFNRIGTYRVILNWRHGNGSDYHAVYNLVIINGRLGQEIFMDLRRTTGGFEANNNAEAITLRVNMAGTPVAMSGVNPRLHASPTAANVSLLQVEDGNVGQSNLVNDFFTLSVPQDNQIRLTRREGVYLPAGSFRIETSVTFQHRTVNSNGQEFVGNMEEFLVFNIRFVEPVNNTPTFPWLQILIGALVLGVLAFGLYASNWLITNSQRQNEARRDHRVATRTVRDLENMILMQEQIEAQAPQEFDDVLSAEDLMMLQDACEGMTDKLQYDSVEEPPAETTKETKPVRSRSTKK